MKGNDGLFVCLCTGGGFPKNVDSKNLTEEVRNHLVSQLANELYFHLACCLTKVAKFVGNDILHNTQGCPLALKSYDDILGILDF